MRFVRHPFFERDLIGIVDHIVEPEALRNELIKRFACYREGYRAPSKRKHGVRPV